MRYTLEPATTRILLASMLVLMVTQMRSEARSIDECDEYSMPPDRIRCYLEAAESAGQPAICERSNDRVVRFNCLSLYAERHLDVSPCRRMAGVDDETMSLRDSCVSGVAIAGRRPELCEQVRVPAIRDACYLMLVEQFDADPSLCERIQGRTARSACGTP